MKFNGGVCSCSCYGDTMDSANIGSDLVFKLKGDAVKFLGDVWV